MQDRRKRALEEMLERRGNGRAPAPVTSSLGESAFCCEFPFQLRAKLWH